MFDVKTVNVGTRVIVGHFLGECMFESVYNIWYSYLLEDDRTMSCDF